MTYYWYSSCQQIYSPKKKKKKKILNGFFTLHALPHHPNYQIPCNSHVPNSTLYITLISPTCIISIPDIALLEGPTLMTSSSLRWLLFLCPIFFFSGASALNYSNASYTSLKSVTSFCKSTPYPDVCFQSLKVHVSININPNIITFLLHSLQTAISEAGKVSTLLSTAGQHSDVIEKQRGTIQDCRELHQITVSSLQRSVSRVRSGDSQKLKDARAFLSASLTNKVTCLEGLDSAAGPSKPTLVNSIVAAYKHVSNCLSVLSKSTPQKGPINRRLMGAPAWASRRILQSSGDEYDPSEVLTVAADGTGNFTTVTDAINFAPNNSNDRIIIYVREGVYEENVDIPSHKTNIVFLGDGSDVTFITGSRSVVDGWTTFRSATVGNVRSLITDFFHFFIIIFF